MYLSSSPFITIITIIVRIEILKLYLIDEANKVTLNLWSRQEPVCSHDLWYIFHALLDAELTLARPAFQVVLEHPSAATTGWPAQAKRFDQTHQHPLCQLSQSIVRFWAKNSCKNITWKYFSLFLVGIEGSCSSFASKTAWPQNLSFSWWRCNLYLSLSFSFLSGEGWSLPVKRAATRYVSISVTVDTWSR